MDYPKFNIEGSVLNSATKEGIYNLRVEAWDKDKKYNDLVGVAQTNRYGKFSIEFDLSYFRVYDPDKAPDLFFKAFRSRELLKSTEDSILWNAERKTEVEIEIEMPAPRPPGKDRITSKQVYGAADFITRSDFTGLLNQVKGKFKRSGAFTRDIVKNSFSKVEISPLRIEGPAMGEVLDQDVTVATRNLEAREISVNEVKEYKPGINRKSLKEITSLPVNLKPGQKVNLYQENGKVRYYSIVRTARVSDEDVSRKIADQDKEIGNLRKDIKQAKEKSTEKDNQILELKKMLESLQKEQLEIKKVMLRSSESKKTGTAGKRSPSSSGTRKKPGIK